MYYLLYYILCGIVILAIDLGRDHFTDPFTKEELKEIFAYEWRIILLSLALWPMFLSWRFFEWVVKMHNS